MDLASALLAALPPLGAIFAEWQNPVSLPLLQQQAARTMASNSLLALPPANNEAALVAHVGRTRAIEQAMAATARGAVTVSSLVPTGIAILTGAIALVHEVADSILLLDSIVVGMAFGTIWLLKSVGANDFFSIGSRKAEYYSSIIYKVNFALIMFCIAVYLKTNWIKILYALRSYLSLQ